VKLLQNSPEASCLLSFEKVSGRSSILIISKRQSWLSSMFYDRDQTLLAEAIFNIVRIDWPDWLALYQFFIVHLQLNVNCGIHPRLKVIVACICYIDCSWLLRRSGASNQGILEEMRTFSSIRA